jgi:hypothetical protein
VSPSIPRLVIVAHRPKAGKEAVLLAEVRDHHALLRSEGLATDREPTIMCAADGTIIEVFEWASQAAIEEAHNNPRVNAMSGRFFACCDTMPLNQLPEAAAMFAEFTPVVFDHTLPSQASPSQREE